MAKATNQDVNEFVQALAHPLQAEINAVRAILQSAAPGIAERIKWNAPSFYYKEDLATIHVKALQHVHIIFHHPAIDQITSPLFRGNYKGRAMVYLQDMNEVQAAQDELTNIIRQLIANIDAPNKTPPDIVLKICVFTQENVPALRLISSAFYCRGKNKDIVLQQMLYLFF